MYPDLVNIYEEPGNDVLANTVMINIERSKHSFSIRVYVEFIQVIKINIMMINYSSYSDVIHAFCIGWDGTDIWATER